MKKGSARTILPTLIVLATFILSSCSQPGTQNLNLEIQVHTLPLLGLGQQKLFSDNTSNCPVDQFDMPGQGFRARGSTGGLAALEPSYSAMPTTITNPSILGAEIYNLAALSDLSRDVTILVIDDFNGDTTISPLKPSVYQLGKDVYKLSERGFSTLLGTRLRQLNIELARLEMTNQISHGALVMNHINAMILGSGHYNDGEFDISDGRVSLKNANTGKYIYVQAVDTEDLDTSVTAVRMGNAIIEELNRDQKQIVVNMSFAIVPCSVRDDFVANRATYPTFQHYSNAVATANDRLRGSAETVVQFRNRVRRELTRPFDNDPLRSTIRSDNITGQLGENGNLIYVAASGNFGLGYSMFPAAWPEVVSASSNDTGLTVRSEFSNKGEVILTGAWSILTNPAGINGNSSDNASVVYAGTSFSAPALAVFSAFDIAQAVPRCEMKLSSSGVPIPDIAHSPLDDKDLSGAIVQYCD